MNIFQEANIYKKLEGVDQACQDLLVGLVWEVNDHVARDVEVRPLKDLPAKPGLSLTQGRARLLHDLASIELQAMELGLRTLAEFPEAPKEFREQLVDVIQDEAKHLKMCLEGMDYLGFRWGEWPVHLALWQSVSSKDSLLDRVLIVHRYLEGSGLDAGDSILRRLNGVPQKGVRPVVKVISEEEIGHVLFGSNWYRRLCQEEGIDPEKDFYPRLDRLFYRIPRRLERLNYQRRMQAGFSESELKNLEDLQKRWCAGSSVIHPQYQKIN